MYPLPNRQLMTFKAYGQCGVGAYCLGGCDIRYSHSINSCAHAPTCKSNDYKLQNLDDIQPNTKYLGDPNKANWVADGKPQQYNGGVLLTMPPDSSGTVLSSTRYVWYGKISTKMTASKGRGVVTAFIMMSDVKDEIDFEFVGLDTSAVQSNYYWQGTLNYTNSANLTAQNTDSTEHTYTIDWQENQLTWSVDGSVLRTLKKSDTWNATTNSYQYPQSPARIQLSLWPAGDPRNGQGTVDWAGGQIDWNSPYMTNGYYSAHVTEVDVQCYDLPANVKQSGTGAYAYNDIKALENNVELVKDPTILASFFATGEHADLNPNAQSSASASGSATTSGSVAVNTQAQTVPGISQGGARGNDGSGTLANQNQGGTSGSGAAGGSGGDASSGWTGSGTNGQFIQGNSGSSGSGTSSTSASAGKTEAVRSGSFLAVLIAIVALVML